MRLKSTQRKSLATVPTSYQGQERRFAQSVSESLDVLTGRRGDVIDRAVTFRDLIDTGVLKLVKGLGTGSGGGTIINPNDNPDGGPTQLPTQPENFTATGGFGIIFLDWDLPPYNGHDYVEIYRLQRASGAAEPTLVQAEEAGVYTRYYGDTYQFSDTNVGSQEQWYYWIRAVNIDGIAGPFYSTDGVDATTALDYLYVSGLIDDILDDNVNNLGLNAEIDKIDAIGTALGNYSNYSGDAVLSVLGAVVAQDSSTGSASTALSKLVAEVFPNGSAQNSSIDILDSQVNDPLTGLSATATAVSSLNTTVTGTGGHASRLDGLEAVLEDPNTGNLLSAQALYNLSVDVGDIEGDIYDSNGNLVIASASSVLDLQTEVYNTDANGNPILNSSKIQQNISSINGIEAKYSVKVDNNGHVSGFGLVSTTNTHQTGTSGALPTSTTSSAFIIAADRFAVAAPYNANSTNNSNVGTNYPFKVITTPTYLYRDGAYVKDADGNFVLIPAGVYIDDAFIHEAQITSASIGEAIITDGHIENLTATKITSGNIQIDAANDIKIYQGKTFFTSTASGFWLGLNNNAGSFHVGANANKYLKFDGNTGDLVTSGLEVRASDGTVLLDAGGLRSADGNNLLYNGGFVHGLDGWSAGSGQTVAVNTTLGRAYTDVGEYIQSQIEIPVTENEPLYVYADVYGADAYCGVIFYKADGSYTSDFVTGTDWSPTAANSLAFRVAKVDYPSYSGNPYVYAKVRFGTSSGGSTTTTWHQVGASKTPPVIDPSYASTYIRDLSVDTLQIADNAVTVPLVKEYPAYPTSGYLTHGSEGFERELSTSANMFAVRFDNLGSGSVPDKVAVMVFFELQAATTGGDWAAATLRIRSSSSSGSWPTGGAVEQALQVNERKGSAPEFSLTFLMDGWTGTKYFWPTISIAKENSGTTSGWWKLQEGNIVILGARK